MPDIGTLKQIQQGSIRILGVSSGTLRPARVQTAIIDYDVPAYEGDYTVDPLFTAQTLATKDRRMTDDLTVEPIYVADTSNPAGGVTVFIGGEFIG